MFRQRVKTIQLDDKVVKLQLWDTKGQERFRSLAAAIYRGAHGVVVVYDVTNAKSFEAVEGWYQEATRYASRANIPVLLVGNKADEAARRQVTTMQGEELASRLGMTFVETSAKTAKGVQEAFYTITSQIKREVDDGRLGGNQRSLYGRPGPSAPLNPQDDSTVRLGIMGNLSRTCC